jgi:hypothetical protein
MVEVTDFYSGVKMGNSTGTKLLAGIGASASVLSLIISLQKPVAAATGDLPEATLNFYQDMRTALAAILEQQVLTINALNNISTSLGLTNQRLLDILNALGAPTTPINQILEPFEKLNQILEKGTPFSVYETKVTGQGALIWAVFDVSSPNVTLSLRFDDLLWKFSIDTLITQGIDRPLFPGVWLTKADGISGHYCLVFSAGDLKGFNYKTRLSITLVYDGAATTATLHEARGIKWTEV